MKQKAEDYGVSDYVLIKGGRHKDSLWRITTKTSTPVKGTERITYDLMCVYTSSKNSYIGEGSSGWSPVYSLDKGEVKLFKSKDIRMRYDIVGLEHEEIDDGRVNLFQENI